MNGWKIVPLSEEHLPALAALEAQCFSHPWSENSLALLLESEGKGFAALDAENSPVGYVGVWLAPDGGEITDICVAPSHRRQGIASALLREAQSFVSAIGLEALFLEVRVSNAGAVALYEGLGFEKTGVRKRFYQNPSEDALTMTWTAPKKRNEEN